jgi:hypothetical protein
MTTNEGLLTFPSCDDGRYTDSGEGGQYVMLAVPAPEGYVDNCCVDVSISLSLPDVCNSPTDLWDEYHRNEDRGKWRHQGDIYRYLTRRAEDATSVTQDATVTPPWVREFHHGLEYKEWASWVIRAIDHDHLSRHVLAAVHLGSSCHSLWNESAGRYWVASETDLTASGALLRYTLKSAFNVEPVLLTFLDT